MAVNIKNQFAFTLIESVIAIVILGIAMITLTSFLFPQIAQSAKPNYEVRASALANSFMTEILARGFDHNSDFDGGWIRCDETDAPSCTPQNNLGPEESDVDAYNDVDDYIGCWYTDSSRAQCTESEAGELSDIFGDGIKEKYPNFRVEVTVVYETDNALTTPLPAPSDTRSMKRIMVSVTGGQYSTLSLHAYKGNY